MDWIFLFCIRLRSVASASFAIVALLWLSLPAQAIPVFARQTGQNCLACHAGGQFPELTPYGRKFKLTGYTMGERSTIPLATMAVVSLAKVNSHAGSTDANIDFPRDGNLDLTTVSLFCCGKISDNIGLFAQWTHDIYDHQNGNGSWAGRSHIDQFDLRFADRFIDIKKDLIVGLSLNSNPGVTDVWNTHNSAFTPVPTYVPVSNALAAKVPFNLPALPIDQSLGDSTAGLTAYSFWKNAVYAEIGAYQAANGIFSVLDQHPPDPFTRLKGMNAYWRLAFNHEWRANSLMVGLHGLDANAYSDPGNLASPTGHFHDIGIDGQYQYILDPHTVTMMASYTHERQKYAGALWDANDPEYSGAFANPSNTLDYLRLKATYTYRAKYGAALAYTSVRGSADSMSYPGNASGRPDSKLWVPEVFCMPLQYMRIGLQYYKWDKYNGVRNNYDPQGSPGRNARDNNAVFVYLWSAY